MAETPNETTPFSDTWTMTTPFVNQYAGDLRIAFRIVFLIMTFPIFFGNFLVVAAILCSRKLRRAKNLCLISLAFADIVVGIGNVVCYSRENTTGVRERGHCLSCLFFTTLGLMGSFLSVFVISMERFVKIVHPLKHARIFRQSRTVLWVLVPWVEAIITEIIFVSWNNFTPGAICSFDLVAKPAVRFFAYGQVGVLLLINGVLYALIPRKVIQHTAQIQDTTLQSKSKEMERRTNVTVLIVLGVLYACWGPFFILSFVPKTLEGRYTAGWATLTAVFVNSLINPVIYAWRNNDFRVAFVDVLACRKCTILRSTAGQRVAQVTSIEVTDYSTA